MYKLSNQFINRMIEEKLSSKEIDFLLYVACFQDDSGKVYSVYYKDICDKIQISTQKFYDILHSLKAKKLIEVEKRESADVSVSLVGNDFKDADKAFAKGYLKVAKIDFQSEKFLSLKAGSKLIYLYMQRFTSGRHGFVETIYLELCNLLGAAKKSVQSYLHELKDAYLLFISLKRNKAYNYEICIKNSTVLYKKVVPNEEDLKKSNYKDHIKRNFGKYLPENPEKCTDDIANLANPVYRRTRERKHFFGLVMDAIHESIRIQKTDKVHSRSHPKVNAAHVNTCLTKTLANT